MINNKYRNYYKFISTRKNYIFISWIRMVTFFNIYILMALILHWGYFLGPQTLDSRISMELSYSNLLLLKDRREGSKIEESHWEGNEMYLSGILRGKNNKFKNIFLNIIIQITFSKNFFSKYNFNWILELLFEKIILIFELKLSLQKIDVLKSIVILKIVLTLSPFKIHCH